MRARRERQSRRRELHIGERLVAGECLYSPADRFSLELQHDGNLVVKTAGGVFYDLGTRGRGIKYVTIDADGRLLFCKADETEEASCGNGGKFLAMQDDGNLCLYPGPEEAAVWATNQFVRHIS